MSKAEYLAINCPHCDGVIEFPTVANGKTINCPHCKTKVRLGDSNSNEDNLREPDAVSGASTHSHDSLEPGSELKHLRRTLGAVASDFESLQSVKRFIVVLLSVIALLLCALLVMVRYASVAVTFLPPTKHASQQWNYKLVNGKALGASHITLDADYKDLANGHTTVSIEELCNELGKAGWQLVSRSDDKKIKSVLDGGNETEITLLFKRPM